MTNFKMAVYEIAKIFQQQKGIMAVAVLTLPFFLISHVGTFNYKNLQHKKLDNYH